MKYNRYGLKVIIRTLFIFLSCVLFAYLYFETHRFFSMLFIAGLIVIQVAWLIYFLNGINRDLERFLLNLYDHDSFLGYNPENIEANFNGVHESFNKINSEFQKIKFDRESKIHFLNNVVNHMKVAFMAYNQEGEIVLLNKAAINIFNKEFRNLEEIRANDELFFQFLSNLTSNFNGVYNYGRTKNDSWPLLVRSSGFILAGDQVRLVSFQNIKSQLDDNEIESWQRLMRVLAHEISNSITPITMLGNNIRTHLESKSIALPGEIKYPENIIKDVIRSSELIEQRGHRLIEFIDSYKSYAKLPKPSLKEVLVEDLFKQIEQYFNEQFITENIQFQMECSSSTNILVDMSLIEQVLINLIQNAIQALKSVENKRIEINHKAINGDTFEICDNGVGIPEDILDKIFIPFFTTKQNGSGIGLSLSKNIMHMHQGSISIQSKPHKTTVTLIFPDKRS
jgi:two-component system, NtrC family, nitrogen regulation sensor histidine kinase NtrY